MMRRMFFCSLKSVLLAGSLFATPALQASEPAKPASAFNEATAQLRQGKWADAYGKFTRLADQGHAESARIALIMLRDGPVLFGSAWEASQPQISRWTKLAAQRSVTVRSQAGE